ncbi:formylglycine-generating enzyme family protein [Schlesneria sp. T3-172]|uniref:formylglycine-generating enzyme family protein n=1 Tax=Schlesneria TaxID=656899 RepID=UPI002F12E4D2
MRRRRFLSLISTATVFLPGWTSTARLQAEEEKTTDLLQTFVDEFVAITPGTASFPASFQMGSDQGEPNEKPVHEVKLSKPFAIAKYEVPQNLFHAVMGYNPSRWPGPRNSAERMSWNEANEFCRKVTAALRADKLIEQDETIRLPTEAEWEYCCRAGTETRYSFGDEPRTKADFPPATSILNEFAWHTGNAAGNDPQVGVLKPNPWGLYDIHGYLWEFTADAWSPNYEQAPADGSAVTSEDESSKIVIRGGSWKDAYPLLTSSARRGLSKTAKDDAIGFRCVKSK